MGSLQSIAQVANDLAECNFAQLVSRENGSTIVATFVWTDFIATRMKGIKKYHHFRMTSSSPGKDLYGSSVIVQKWRQTC